MNSNTKGLARAACAALAAFATPAIALAETPSGPSQPVAVAAWRTERGVGLLGLDGQTWQLSLLDQNGDTPLAISGSGTRVAVVGGPDSGIWIADVRTAPATPGWPRSAPCSAPRTSA